jgi:GrpB-like predicted nucleotidyltransferase (UPF0157 family)
MLRRIEVIPYRDSWPAQFETEAERLAGVFRERLLRIHHVGSTAVPGLAAKPTIDILVEVKGGTSIPIYYADMHRLGYECRGECLDAVIPGTPGRYYFPKVENEQHVVHVHVCEEGHVQIAELLALRDYLRIHPASAEAYGIHKARLADEFVHDNVAYMRGKDPMVKEILGRAMQWKGGLVPCASRLTSSCSGP